MEKGCHHDVIDVEVTISRPTADVFDHSSPAEVAETVNLTWRR